MFYFKLESGGFVKIDNPALLPPGMKLYIKSEDGSFIPVSMGKDTNTEVANQQAAPQAPAIKVAETDPVKELANVVRELTTSVSKIKEKEEEVNAKLAAYKEMGQKGFVIPNAEIPENSPAGADLSKTVLSRVNMAVQGKRLMDKRFYPGYQIKDESTKYKVAKFMCYFIKAGLQGSRKATDEFWDTYTPVFKAEGKTAIGDSGNTFPTTNTVEEEILSFARESSVALQYANVVEMNAEKQTYPAQQTGTSVAWGNTTAESEATVADVQLSAEELSAYSSVKNTTLDDSPSDIVSWLFTDMAEATGLEVDNVMWNGDGSSTYGSVSGIFLTASYSVVLGSGSTAFSQVSSLDLSEMISKLDGPKKQGARFFMHGEILHFVRTLVDSNNRPIFIDTIGSSIPPSIWGYPYTESTKCPSTSAANTYFMCFGNLRYFFVGRRRGVTNLQVNPYQNWTTNRTCFKVYSRWGLKTGLAAGLVRMKTPSE